MNTTSNRRRHRGFVSYMLVLSTGMVLTLLTIYAYRRAVDAQSVQSKVQLRVDYAEKEEAILRAIVALTPNRAIRAMQQDSNLNTTKSDPLRWQNIFADALDLANSRTSISSNMVSTLGIPKLVIANAGDSALGSPDKIFKAIPQETGYVSAGINRSLGTGFPPALTSNDSTTSTRDFIYPIISSKKAYGSLAQSGVGLPVASYPNFNLLNYPQINFGYAKPGENFVAKRNWWSFSVDVAASDGDTTLVARKKRDYVLSIYEIPSQLAISASSFMSIGQYASGDAWQNVSIDGGMFVGKAEVTGNTALTSLSSRRGMSLSSGTTIGGQSFANNPFTPGVRESYQVTTGQFFPVSLASESGRAAFIPINRGAEFFDRFSNTDETNVLSTTSWNNYSLGAMQCAMRLDITQTQSSTNLTPTMLRFQYYQTNGTRATMQMPLNSAVMTSLPPGYVKVCDENQSYTFVNAVDVAYGVSGGFTFRQGLSGTINFNNSTFGDPKVGTFKGGYWRPRGPFEIQSLAGGQTCVAVYPQRIPSFLNTINAANAVTNNSLVVNVDYSVTGLNNVNRKPLIPCTSNDYGLIVKECGDLTAFNKGFSLVTNLRLYIGDDFNIVPTSPPAGYTPAVTASNPTGRFMPPCSLFAPEKRYGVDVDPFAVSLSGQIGSLASDSVTNPIRPLDSKSVSGQNIGADRIRVNLSPLRHPAELPPITMMNWLVLLEERRKEFY
jgi:hypothetical protein